MNKRPATLLIDRAYIRDVAELAHTYNSGKNSTMINGNKASITFKEIVSSPIWLLDLRRNKTSFLWLWGTEQDWYFIRHDTNGTGDFITRIDDPKVLENYQDYQAHLKEMQHYSFSPYDLEKAWATRQKLNTVSLHASLLTT